MKKRKASRSFRRRALLLLPAALLLFSLFPLGKALLASRWNLTGRAASGRVPRVEMSWEAAMADGVLSQEELAVHYAPEIHAAVNTLLSSSGRGDFLAAADYDGDWAADNNWENLDRFPLNAAVYWSVQETETHFFIGYYFYHPRDDAEVSRDRHENDLEGFMAAVPRPLEGFQAPVLLYTQAHGRVPFYFDGDRAVTEGSRRGGGLLLDGDRPVVYIAPNGTLDRAGHSVESGGDHSTYWAAGNSGVRYYHGGAAEEPATWKGSYAANPCSYELRGLDELWSRRNGPYGDGHLFGRYDAFNGDNFREDAANPPWGWQNRTAWGFPGSFLSDPAWTAARALSGLDGFSETYLSNRWADWKLTFQFVSRGGVALRLLRDGRPVSSESWWRIAQDGSLSVGAEGRQTLFMAGPEESVWTLQALDEGGNAAQDCEIIWRAEYLH